MAVSGFFSETYRTMHQTYPCPYYNDGRMTAVDMVFPREHQSDYYHLFLRLGYRRYYRFFYNQVCPNCQDCIPIRVEPEQFVPSRSQRRTLRANREVRVEVREKPEITEEKLSLFRKYKMTKHNEPDGDDFGQELEHLHTGYPYILEMDYYLEDRLIAVGIVDEGEDCLSSNYFYYDTDFLSLRPGVFSVLKEIELASQRKKRYYYLGYYLENIQRMAYKKQFRPNQVLVSAQWVDFLR